MSQPPSESNARRGLVAALAGFVLVGLGGYGWWEGRDLMELLPVDAAELEAGRPTPGRWLEVSGRVLGQERIIWGSEEPRETYVPVVSNAWQPGAPVAVFARATDAHSGEPGRLLFHEKPSVSGLVDPDGLPDELRRFFVENGCPPADNALVLDFHAVPGAGPQLSRIAALAGALLLVLAGWLRWSSSRQAAKAVGQGRAPLEHDKPDVEAPRGRK